MLGHYNASLRVTTHDEKKEMSNISKGSGDMTLSNSSSTDDENERIRKGLMSTIEAIKNVDREYEEKLMRECTSYYNSLFMHKY